MEKKANYLVLYKKLRSRFGHLGWWPGETRDEIMIGAILTQQTQWRNVELAIGNLKKARLIRLSRLKDAGRGEVERLVRPSGFYRQKAARLIGFARHIYSNYNSIDEFFSRGPAELRKELLSINGIGEETADSIALYAAGKPLFVIDAYTKRIMSRVYGTPQDIKYGNLQSLIVRSIKPDIELYKDFHAQLVELGKRHCRTTPICEGCPANGICAYYIRRKQTDAK